MSLSDGKYFSHLKARLQKLIGIAPLKTSSTRYFLQPGKVKWCAKYAIFLIPSCMLEALFVNGLSNDRHLQRRSLPMRELFTEREIFSRCLNFVGRFAPVISPVLRVTTRTCLADTAVPAAGMKIVRSGVMLRLILQNAFHPAFGRTSHDRLARR